MDLTVLFGDTFDDSLMLKLDVREGGREGERHLALL